MGGLDGVVCLNKVDLARGEEDRKRMEYLGAVGYKTLVTSALTGEGTDEFREVLKGRLTVLMGHSGVGKSSLLRCVSPDLPLRIGAVSRKTGRGRHVTTAPEIHRLFEGTFVVDTPGVREFQPAGLSERDLAGCFPDLAGFIDDCRYPTCLHETEPDCAVKEAVEAQRIHPLRYTGYLKILRSLRGGRGKGRYFQ
jgi:ribosome biogenesis GTPase